MNQFISGIGIPPLTYEIIKKREREIGPFIEFFANESCKAATEEEVSLTKKNGNTEPGQNQAGIDASYDAAWQRRGSGRTYNSFSGKMQDTKNDKLRHEDKILQNL